MFLTNNNLNSKLAVNTFSNFDNILNNVKKYDSKRKSMFVKDNIGFSKMKQSSRCDKSKKNDSKFASDKQIQTSLKQNSSKNMFLSQFNNSRKVIDGKFNLNYFWFLNFRNFIEVKSRSKSKRSKSKFKAKSRKKLKIMNK